MKPEISVVITTFNQPFKVVRRSLDSVLLQEDVRFELIIADDHSSEDLTALYEAYFKNRDFSSYQILRHERNVKTVLNLAHALSLASAPLTKAIDAGDLLYSEHTLRDIVDFSVAHDILVGFGNITRFWTDSSGALLQATYQAPRDKAAFDAGLSQDRRAIFLHQMNTADWIPAPAQFYRTEYYQNLLYRLSSDYGVAYCQDFTTVLALIDTPIFYFDAPIYWYEWGTGISTNGSLASRKRLYADHLSFYQAMRREMPFGLSLNAAYASYLARRFIALYTPLYHAAVSLTRSDEPQASALSSTFFLSCWQSDESR